MKQQLRKQQFKSLLLAVLAFMPLAASAQTYPIAINETNFPDVDFRNFLLFQSYGADGVLTEDEIKGITELRPYYSCSSLKGIEYFTALEKLTCSSGITSLDVSKNTALKELRCDNGELTSLDVSKNTALTYLSCRGNKLTSLNVSNTALEELFCSDNNLTSLDVSGLTTLIRVDCDGNNQLTSLNASGCTALTRAGDSYGGGLNWRNTSLTTLDISNCTSLERLNIEDCPLMTLNASGCTALTTFYLSLSGSQLTTVDVSNCTALSSLFSLYMYSPQLMTLNASGCTALEDIRFDLQEGVLETLDASNCTALKELYCPQNKLTSLNVSNCTALTELRCYENQLKAEGMDAFIKSLPENTTAEKHTLAIFNGGSDKEGNVCTTDHVAIAKTKGWSVENRWGVEYEGVATGITLPTIESIDENTPIYDLSGKRVNNLQGKKGVYIVGGKKVLVK